MALPIAIAPGEIERKQSLGAAITLCYDAAGLSPKQVLATCRMDKAQLSRWESGAEGVCWPKLAALMDACPCCGSCTSGAMTSRPCAGGKATWSAACALLKKSATR